MHETLSLYLVLYLTAIGCTPLHSSLTHILTNRNAVHNQTIISVFLHPMINLKSRKLPRIQEYKLLFIRIGLAYVFYFLARALFYLYNRDLIEVASVFEFIRLSWHGLVFDTTAILYVNSLFIVLSLLPLYVNTKKGFQQFLLWLYFITNLTAYATNFIDFIYYRFNFGRSTIAMTESVAHESNKMLLFGNFLVRYWHVFLLFFGLSYLWIFLYKKRMPVYQKVGNPVQYWV